MSLRNFKRAPRFPLLTVYSLYNPQDCGYDGFHSMIRLCSMAQLSLREDFQGCLTYSYEPFISGSWAWSLRSQKDSKHERDSMQGASLWQGKWVASRSWEWPLADSQEGNRTLILQLLQGTEFFHTMPDNLWWGYIPINPWYIEKNHKSKMHLMQLTYQTWELSLAYLKRAQNTIYKNAGNTVHNKVLTVYPGDLVPDWDLWLLSRPRVIREYHTEYC